MKLEFAGQRFLKNTQTLNFMKICPVGAKMVCVDRKRGSQDVLCWQMKGRQADVMKLTVTFTILQMCLKNQYKSLKTSHSDSEMQMTYVFKQQSPLFPKFQTSDCCNVYKLHNKS